MIVQRSLDEHFGLRQSIRSEIVICQGAGLVRVIEKHHSPGTFYTVCRLDELRGRAPHRCCVLIHVRLHAGDQGVEIYPQRDGGFVKASNRGNDSLVECGEFWSCAHIEFSSVHQVWRACSSSRPLLWV